MVYKITRFEEGYMCTVYDTLWPEMVFYGRTRNEALKFATKFVYNKTYNEIYRNQKYHNEKSKGYSF